MRVLKEPEERKSEILDAAEFLFTTKGYAKTTIMDILHAVGIAKGTFYYYFTSKEELMDSIIERVCRHDVIRAKEIAADTTLNPIEKIFRVLLEQKPEKGDLKDKMIEQFHQPNNAEMHQKSIVQAILQLSPVLAEIVQQGVAKGIFVTEYPRESMEFLLSAGQTMFGDALFQRTPEETAQKTMAFIAIMEIVLGAEKGAFACMIEILTKNRR